MSTRPQIPDEAAAAPASARFGKFIRTKKLGAGGMGEVWKAYDSELGRWVALKFLKGGNDEELARFQREAQTAARLEHPNIAAIYDVGEDQARHYIAMQFVEGQTLGTVPRTDRRHVAALVRDAAKAVAFANERGVIHRDLKPDNVMVSREGHVFVMDFGLARSVEGDSKLSMSGMVVGTPAYMPPEQARGERVDARADVYGLGATLYELLTNRQAVRGATVFEMLVNVQTEEPKAPRRIDPSIDGDLETIVLKCLEKEPTRRYGTTAALAADLQRWLDGEPISARPASIAYRVRKRLAKRKAVVALSLVAIAAILAGGAFGIVQRLRASDIEQRVAVKVERARELVRKAQAMAYRESYSPDDWKAKLDGGERLCREVLAEYDGYAPTHVVLGLITAERDDLDGAVAAFGAAITRNAAYEQAYLERAKALAEQALREEHEDFSGEAPEPRVALERQLARAALDDISHANIAGLESGERIVIELLVRLLRDGPTGIVNEVETRARQPGFDERLWRIAAEAEHRQVPVGKPHDYAERYVKARPGDAVAWSRLAHFLYDAAAYARSVTACDRAIALRADYAEAYYNRGLAGREAKASVADFDRALELRPGFVQVLLHRGQCKLRAGDPAGAEADLDRLIAVKPELAPAFYVRGNIRKERKDPAGAEADFDRAVVLLPTFARALCNRGVLKSDRGDYRAALADFEAALAAKPNFGPGLSGRGMTKQKMGDLRGALEDFNLLVKIAPSSSSLINRAKLRHLARDFRGALKDADEAIRLSDTAEARHTRGLVRLVLRDGKGALEDADRMIALGDDGADARFLRADALQSLERHREALVDFDRAMSLKPGAAIMHGNRALSRQMTGDYRGAMEDFDRAIELDGSMIGPWAGRACLKAAQKDLKGARADFEKAIGLDPLHAETFYTRGGVLGRAGDFRGALKDFDRAIELDPGHAKAHTERGIAKAMLKDLPGAMKDFDRAIELDPASPLMRFNRALARQQAGDVKGTIEDLEKALELAPPDWNRRKIVEEELKKLK